MKDAFVTYLTSLGGTSVIIGRIEAIYRICQQMSPNELTDLFVTDYITADGTREFENLWFFSQAAAMEAKQFTTKDDFDYLVIKGRVYYWTIEKQDYDFETTTDASRMNLQFSVQYPSVGNLKAARNNCNFLRDIMRTYIIPNLAS